MAVFSIILIMKEKGDCRIREWALIGAFILFMIFGMSVQAFMTTINVSPEKMRQIYLTGLVGYGIGVLILPFLLPLADLRQGLRPKRYKLRLILLSLFFLPNIIVRLFGQEAWLTSNFLSGFMSIGNSVVAVLLYSCIFSLSANCNEVSRASCNEVSRAKMRFFWVAVAYSAADLTFRLIMGYGQESLSVFLFYGVGLILAASGVFIFIYLISFPKTSTLLPDKPEIKNKFVGFPVYLLPIIAVFIIFITNNSANQFFLTARNLPLPPGLNLQSICIIVSLLLLGFFASLKWQSFLKFFVIACSAVLVFAPSLLLFTELQPLFLIIYTLNIITTRMFLIFFPFIIVDLFWKNEKRNVILTYLLPVSIQLINVVVMMPNNLIKIGDHDKAYAVLLLTAAALVFFFLMWKVLKSMQSDDQKIERKIPVDLNELFKEYKLTERECEVACLLFEEGLTNDEIAGRIFRSTATIESCLTQIYRKFNVRGRTEFIAKYGRGVV